MTKARTPDRRVQRTRRGLHEAMLALMVERGWDAIGVQDICQHADIGRSTFYMHFSGKEELLMSGFDDLRGELRARLMAAGDRGAGPLPFARGLIEHVHENQRIFRAAIGKRSGYVVQRHFRELVLGMVKEDLSALAPSVWQRDATAHYVAGAFVELLTWWIDGRRQQKSADIEMLFDHLTKSAIEQLRVMK